MSFLRKDYILFFLVLVLCSFLFGWKAHSFQSNVESKKNTLSTTAPSIRIPENTRPSDVFSVKITAALATSTITVPEDGWITAFSQEIKGAPESALRFSRVYDNSTPDPLCNDLGQTLFSMSIEKVPSIDFPPGHGYPVKKGTEFLVLGGFANFSDTPYEDVRFTVHLSFVPKSSGRVLKEAHPIFLNAVCGSLFVVPPYSSNYTRWLERPYIIPFDGRLVLFGSHAHSFAERIFLKLNDYVIWNTSPIHFSDGKNLGNPIYRTPFNGVPVKKGDLLDLGTVYRNPKDTPTDAMSSMYIHIVPTSEDYSPVEHHH